MTSLRPVLLAGGRSSRTGTRKELLCLPNDEPVFVRMISLIYKAMPESNSVYLSLRNRTHCKSPSDSTKSTKYPKMCSDSKHAVAYCMYKYYTTITMSLSKPWGYRSSVRIFKSSPARSNVQLADRRMRPPTFDRR